MSREGAPVSQSPSIAPLWTTASAGADALLLAHWQVTGFGYSTDAGREMGHAIAPRLQGVCCVRRSSALSEEAA